MTQEEIHGYKRSRSTCHILMRIYEGEDVIGPHLTETEKKRVLKKMHMLIRDGFLDSEYRVTEKGSEKCKKDMMRYSDDENSSLGNFVLKVDTE